uniref:Uncharacterized protein n=1 Tax=Fagus sylvatica TaxID=28930 RepID=A0A2N9G9D6_FAGSY
MAKVPMVKCRKDVLTSTWTCCQGHQHHQNLRGEIPNWMTALTVREWRRRAARFSENIPSGGEKWRPRACPLLDEKEMIKIFVDTLKNPYFNRIVGLQLQFLVDLILVEERVEDAVKTKRMVDMPALMALVEQIAKRTLVEKNEEGV